MAFFFAKFIVSIAEVSFIFHSNEATLKSIENRKKVDGQLQNLFLIFSNTKFFISNHSPTFALPKFKIHNQAGVVKLVDTLDLGSSAVRHGGSSPSTRTKQS